MKQVIQLFVLSMLFISFAGSQTWQWAKTSSASDPIYGVSPNAIATDASGNIYTAGYFGGTYTNGGDSVVSHGLIDIFFSKHNPNGTALWTKSMGSVKWNESADAMAVDNAGNLFLAGTIGDSAYIGGVITKFPQIVQDFVAKFDLNGNLVWIKTGTGTAVNITPDGTGGCFVAGRGKLFIAKFASNGDIVWSHTNSEYGFCKGNAIGFDATGNLYMVGAVQSVAVFGADTLKTSSQFDLDILIVKYNGLGILQWAKRAGAAGTNYDYTWSIAVEPAGNFYFCGAFSGAMGFGSDTLRAGAVSAFVAKYNSDGAPIWEKAVSALPGAFVGSTNRKILRTAAGDMYVAGWAGGNVLVGTDTVEGYQSYVYKMYANGDVLFIRKSVNASIISVPQIVSAALDPSGNVVVCGNVAYVCKFGTESVGLASGVTAGFVVKLSTVATGVRETASGIPAGFRLEQNYPNPFNPSTSLQFTVAKAGFAALKVYSILGQEVATLFEGDLAPGSYSATFDAASLASGVYFATLTSGSQTETRAMLLQR